MTDPDPIRISQEVTDAIVVGDITMVGNVYGDVTVLRELPSYRLVSMLSSFVDGGAASAGQGPSHRDAPSYLLDATRKVVPFRGRDGELAELVAWRDASPPCAIRVISGPGGHGKSRLAAEFAHQSQHAGWIVLTAVERADTYIGGITDIDGHASRPRPQDTSPAVLVIVDYADRWRLETLIALLREMEYRSVKARIRVLLLARHGPSLWESVASELDRGTAMLSPPLVLGELDKAAQREDSFRQASEAFRVALGAGDGPIDPPSDLADADYGSPLTMHMAALAAVHARIEGAPAPARENLSLFLLRRERRYWQRMCRAAAADALIEPVSADTVARSTYIATLFGPLPTAASEAALQRAGLAKGDAQAHTVAAFHQRIYPLDDTSTALGPLRPDRFGEDYVAYMLDSGEGDYLWRMATDLAGTAIGEVIADGTESSPVVVGTLAGRQFLNVLAAAAEDDRHPHLRSRLFGVLESTRRLALCVSGPVLAFLNRTAPTDLLAVIQETLPFSTELLRQNAALAQRLLEEIPANAPVSLRARRARHASAALSHLGDRRAALAYAERAVDIYRQLAAGEPEAYLPKLADALSNLGTALNDVGKRHEALVAGQEAIHIFRRLTKAEHVSQMRVENAGHLPEMASVLATLSYRLSEAGQAEAAVDAAQEAVNIFQALNTIRPRGYLAQLGTSLTNLGSALSAAGRREDAVTACQSAADIYRELAAASPTWYLPNLAVALNNLAGRKAAIGDPTDALPLIRESIGIFRDLADQYPAAYQVELARSLDNLKLRLLELGDRGRASSAAQEAIGIFRSLAAIDAPLHAPGFGSYLHEHAIQMEQAGDMPAAVAALQECVHVRRKLAHENPVYLPNLAAALRDRGALLWKVGDHAAALSHTEEAVTVFRPWAADHKQQHARTLSNYYAMLSAVGNNIPSRLPIAHELVIAFRQLAQDDATFLPDLAKSLTSLTFDMLRSMGAASGRDAVGLVQEAVSIYRRLAPTDRTQLPNLAYALYCLQAASFTAGAKQQALQAIQEGASIYGTLSRDDPTHLPALAVALGSLAALQSNLGDRQSAIASARDSIGVYKQLATNDPGSLRQLANAYNHFVQVAGEQALGLADTQEATATYRKLAQVDPAVHRARLSVWLTNLAMRLEEARDKESAIAALNEAVAIYRELAPQNPDVLSLDLAKTAFNIAMIMVHRGNPSAAQAFGLEAVKAYHRLAKSSPDSHMTGLAEAYLIFSMACHAARALDHAKAAAQLAIQTFDRLELTQAATVQHLRQMAQDVLNEIAAGR